MKNYAKILRAKEVNEDFAVWVKDNLPNLLNEETNRIRRELRFKNRVRQTI